MRNATGGVALYDVAEHYNLGDSLIWAAAARLVAELHHSTKVVCAGSQNGSPDGFPMCDVQQTVKAIGKGGVILLSGGGNWGDLWRQVHTSRVGYLQEMHAALIKEGVKDVKVCTVAC